MKPDKIKAALNETICSLGNFSWFFASNPQKDFTRKRKMPFEKVITSILAFRNGSLTNELLDVFQFDSRVVSTSAFVQQRSKILPAAFEYLFSAFTKKVEQNKTYKGYRLLAVDGSDIQIPADANDMGSFYPCANGQKSYNLLHLNAMYDLLGHLYVDAILHKSRRSDECGALTAMVDRFDSAENAILLADRGYESYNNLAHIQKKGWKFLIRIKNGATGITSGLVLPKEDAFDVPFQLLLTRKQSNSVKELQKGKNSCKFFPSKARFDYLPKKQKNRDAVVFFKLSFRLVRFPISDTMQETIITNLDADEFPAAEIKRLYAMRWGIETSFRELKYTLGLLHLHSKKVEFIHQEIFAKLTMYNFCESITQSVVIQQANKKHDYKVNFSAAVHICLQFFLGRIAPPNVEAFLARYISPIRRGRKYSRRLTPKAAVSFLYRVA